MHIDLYDRNYHGKNFSWWAHLAACYLCELLWQLVVYLAFLMCATCVCHFVQCNLNETLSMLISPVKLDSVFVSKCCLSYLVGFVSPVVKFIKIESWPFRLVEINVVCFLP